METILNPKDVVYVIDVSLSMGKSVSDYRPNKLIAVLQLISTVIERRISRNKDRIGLVVFFSQAVPLLPVTNDLTAIMRSLAIINKTYEGSAIGDAIFEAAKLLQDSVREKEIIVVTDGDYNAGAPLELAAIYANNMKTKLIVITIGLKDKMKITNTLEFLSSNNLLTWIHTDKRSETLRALLTTAGLEVRESLI